jgi:hypothetical protein
MILLSRIAADALREIKVRTHQPRENRMCGYFLGTGSLCHRAPTEMHCGGALLAPRDACCAATT